MPKRNNPFGDHSSLQLKTHIGTKEVDRGVDQVTRMQSVYDKTHKLLFSGMRDYTTQTKKTNNNDKDFDCLEVQFNPGAESVKKDNLKQMHLGNHCQLVEDVDMETYEAENVQGGLVNCPSPNDCKVDFSFGRTPSENSPPGFVSASSLLLTSPQSSAFGTGPGKNVFERMRCAQMNLASKSKLVGGACHGCTKPVHAREVIKCQFCENYVCSTCTRQCSGCFQHFCQLCSVLNYSEVREKAFCFGCNGR